MGLRLINYVNNQLATPSMYATYLAARPPAGVLGRLFISTDTHEIYRDEVAGWNLIADAGAGSGGTLQSVTYNGNTTTYGIVIQSGDLYVSNGTTIYNSRLTNGSILFASSGTGKIDQDNSNFFWDATNFRLGIRTNAPAAALDVTGASPVVGIFNNSTTAATFLTFRTQTVDKWYIGNDHSNNDSYVIYDVTNTTNRLIITASGYTNLNTKLIVGNTTPSSTYQFDVYGSGRLTGALFTQSYFVAGGTALPTGWTGSIQTYSGLSTPAEAHIYNMGVVGTQLASSSNANIWGIGVYGAGYTNGGTRSAGVMGDGEVNASADTGSAIGVRGYATATHSGGLNIGILGDASASSTGNYGIYTNMASGATMWANYHAGTAVNYFGGNTLIGNTTDNGYKLQVTGRISSTGGYDVLGGAATAYVSVNGVSSNTVGSGPYMAVVQTSNSYQILQQLSASYNLDYWSYRGSWTKVSSIDGATGVYTPLSDKNKKKDFEDSKIGLDAILNLKPTLFRMINEINTNKHLGFIAQEVKDYIPQAYIEQDGFIGLQDRPIIAALVKSIQELNEKLVRNNIN